MFVHVERPHSGTSGHVRRNKLYFCMFGAVPEFYDFLLLLLPAEGLVDTVGAVPLVVPVQIKRFN